MAPVLKAVLNLNTDSIQVGMNNLPEAKIHLKDKIVAHALFQATVINRQEQTHRAEQGYSRLHPLH